jgi:hypothetical protein
MTKAILLVMFLLPIIGSCQNQEVDINQVSLSDYIKKEKDFVGGKILNSDYSTNFNELGLASYIRSNNSVPDIDLIVRYLYFKNDSLIKEIRNEWDIANHNQKLDNKKDLKFRTDLVSFYSSLEQSLKNNYGKGNTNGKIPKNINAKDTYSKEIKWTLEKTTIKLNIMMSNIYDEPKKTFPSHRIYLTYQATNLDDKPEYGNSELIKRNRKAIPNIENPVVSSIEPTFPNCENSTEKISCMNNKVRDLILQRVKQENIQIKKDTLKVGFMVQIDGTIKPTKNNIKSNNLVLEKIALETIENLPIIIPSYSERIKQNVTYGNSFYIIIENNRITNYE